jgi:hypothetical protein
MSLILAPRSLRRIAPTAAVLAAVGVMSAVSFLPAAAQVRPAAAVSPGPTPTPVVAPVIAAVGDIACSPTSGSFNKGKGTNSGCQQNAVAALLKGRTIAAFLPLGDEQYQVGALSAFKASYHKAFGSYLAISQPVPGNHEYLTSGASGYYSYFGARAHKSSKGTYSFNIGSWHVIAINAPACSGASCGPNSALAKWVSADVKKNAASKCTLAYWHEPVWSLGAHPTYAPIAPVWNVLQKAGVDVVLTGHDHNYQRFAPLGQAKYNLSAGTVVPPTMARTTGMRQFIVGTGGEGNYAWSSHVPVATSRAVEVKATNPNHGVFGVLLVSLNKGSYSWRFVQARTTGAKAFSDSGTTACH